MCSRVRTLASIPLPPLKKKQSRQKAPWLAHGTSLTSRLWWGNASTDFSHHPDTPTTPRGARPPRPLRPRQRASSGGTFLHPYIPCANLPSQPSSHSINEPTAGAARPRRPPAVQGDAAKGGAGPHQRHGGELARLGRWSGLWGRGVAPRAALHARRLAAHQVPRLHHADPGRPRQLHWLGHRHPELARARRVGHGAGRAPAAKGGGRRLCAAAAGAGQERRPTGQRGGRRGWVLGAAPATTHGRREWRGGGGVSAGGNKNTTHTTCVGHKVVLDKRREAPKRKPVHT